jgi:hypothetical protein
MPSRTNEETLFGREPADPQPSHKGSLFQASIALPEPSVAPVRSTGLRASPVVLFNSYQLLTDVSLWSCGRRTASSKRSGKSTGLLLATDTAGGRYWSYYLLPQT